MAAPMPSGSRSAKRSRPQRMSDSTISFAALVRFETTAFSGASAFVARSGADMMLAGQRKQQNALRTARSHACRSQGRGNGVVEFK